MEFGRFWGNGRIDCPRFHVQSPPKCVYTVKISGGKGTAFASAPLPKGGARSSTVGATVGNAEACEACPRGRRRWMKRVGPDPRTALEFPEKPKKPGRKPR